MAHALLIFNDPFRLSFRVDQSEKSPLVDLCLVVNELETLVFLQTSIIFVNKYSPRTMSKTCGVKKNSVSFFWFHNVPRGEPVVV